MTCDKYEDMLLLAAASNKLDPKLARHLDHCSTCRTTLCSERELFSRIDNTLRVQVNEEPPPGFLAQLRLQLSKELMSQPGSNRVWQVAGAALAVALVAMFYPLVNARPSSVQRNLQTPTIRVSQAARVTQSPYLKEELGVRPRHHSKRSAAIAASQQPEVLVPPDEQIAFAQFVACVARRDAMAQAVVTPAANKTVKRNTDLPQVSLVQVADLQLDRARHEGWIDRTDSSE